ncbi:DUF4102 domain-containing protein [Roseateles sp. DAIF2]|uniref:Arm DNA-binding domain-containing protein n=1 Tax=Roseateles sp. DAIF2 TaxID=2714952 RepID=UPI0018A26055|nr:Arm DNA-binding domain-containing protein [Roseateles sp. DAIF2]QPF74376.1 DUF4102 domain-containing protein [Roseateles sp. DAIF2]
MPATAHVEVESDGAGRNRRSALTEVAIKAAKPTPTSYKLWDKNGLHLLATPAGSKLWRWGYRFAGKEKLMAFGAYPLIALRQVREAHEDARRLLAAGTDPMEARKTAKVEQRLAAQNSFAAVAKLWWASWKSARSDSWTSLTSSGSRRWSWRTHAPHPDLQFLAQSA